MDKLALLNKILDLGYSIRKLSELTKIPEQRIYKWKAEKGSPKFDDYQTLLDTYERLRPNPTLDFGAKPSESKEIKAIRERSEEQREYIDMLKAEVKRLKNELELARAPVVNVKIKKTGA